MKLHQVRVNRKARMIKFVIVILEGRGTIRASYRTNDDPVFHRYTDIVSHGEMSPDKRFNVDNIARQVKGGREIAL